MTINESRRRPRPASDNVRASRDRARTPDRPRAANMETSTMHGATVPNAETDAQRLAQMTLRERKRAAMQRMTGEELPERLPRRERRAERRPAHEREQRLSKLPPHPPGVYFAILGLVAVFVMFGLVMVLSASAASEIAQGNSAYRIFTRQIIWAVLGLVCGFIVTRVPYDRCEVLVKPAFIVSVVLMVATLIPGIGSNINGAQSWLSVGPLSFQPSELMKFTMIAMLASYFHRHHDQVADMRYGLYPLGIIVGLGAGIAFWQGDLGSAVVMGAIGLGVGLVAGVPLVHLGMLTMSASVLSALAIMSDSRRLNRILAFMDIEGNKDDIAYQIWQSRLSIANGGWFGSGIGNSRSKYGFLPYAHSDFIFAVIADELGVVGALSVIGGFVFLVYAGMQVALAAPDRFGMFLAGGISAWFGLQAFVHLGGVAGVLPVTGLTLPFFSAGGSSLLVSMVGAAVLLNVARRAVTDTAVTRAAGGDVAAKLPAGGSAPAGASGTRRLNPVT